MNGLLVVQLLDDLLDSAVAVLTNPPTRQFIGHGEWAHDCEAVVVEVLGADVTQVDPGMCATTDNINLAVTVLRCFIPATSTEPVPAASGINADSYTLAHDLGDLIGGLGDRWAAGTLFPTPAGIGCGQVQIVGAVPIGPEGGYAGWQVNITVTP